MNNYRVYYRTEVLGLTIEEGQMDVQATTHNGAIEAFKAVLDVKGSVDVYVSGVDRLVGSWNQR